MIAAIKPPPAHLPLAVRIAYLRIQMSVLHARIDALLAQPLGGRHG